MLVVVMDVAAAMTVLLFDTSWPDTVVPLRRPGRYVVVLAAADAVASLLRSSYLMLMSSSVVGKGVVGRGAVVGEVPEIDSYPDDASGHDDSAGSPSSSHPLPDRLQPLLHHHSHYYPLHCALP